MRDFLAAPLLLLCFVGAIPLLLRKNEIFVFEERRADATSRGQCQEISSSMWPYCTFFIGPRTILQRGEGLALVPIFTHCVHVI